MKPFIENEDSGLYSILLHGVVDPLVVGNDHGVAPHRAVVLKKILVLNCGQNHYS